MCEIISGVILAEIVKSNHSSTLGVATLGESIVFFSDVLAEVRIPTEKITAVELEWVKFITHWYHSTPGWYCGIKITIDITVLPWI